MRFKTVDFEGESLEIGPNSDATALIVSMKEEAVGEWPEVFLPMAEVARLHAYLGEVIGDGWQDIASAVPPNGYEYGETVRVLVWNKTWGVQLGYMGWHPGDRVFAGSGGFHGAEWTHWRPLPAGPVLAKEGE